MMELTLSRDSPTNTLILNAGGTPLYHICTPFKWTRRTTTIFRGGSSMRSPDSSVPPDPASSSLDGSTISPDSSEIARIHWNYVDSPRLVYDGRIVEFSKFMPAGGFMWMTRTFTAPDGKSYIWRMGWGSCHLELNDGFKPAKLIARFKEANLLKGSKSILEIDEAGSHILDLIVITWVFVEKYRRDGESK